MAFFDDVTIHAKAGKGGDGLVHFRHEKFVDRGGPSGGDGGKGGDVFVEGVDDLAYLQAYRTAKRYAAGDGGEGGTMQKSGHRGDDVVLKVPVGSVVTNMTTGYAVEVLHAGERHTMLAGGRGGWGNVHFTSPTNRTPMHAEPGKDGEEADLHVELKMVVDVGLIGLPNAGKSSLLNELTAARARVGAYPFTTLEPNLGVYGKIILADIPGLIEGASQGKGLGHKFLRHVSRAKIILHCISLEPEEADSIATRYRLIRDELGAHDETLLAKPEIIVLTKHDLVSPEVAAQSLAKAEKLAAQALMVSIYDQDAVNKLGTALEEALHAFQNPVATA